MPPRKPIKFGPKPVSKPAPTVKKTPEPLAPGSVSRWIDDMILFLGPLKPMDHQSLNAVAVRSSQHDRDEILRLLHTYKGKP